MAATLTCVARAATSPAVWTGLGPNDRWTTPANWQGNTAPANDGTASVLFALETKPFVLVDPSQSVLGLTFDFTGFDTYGYVSLRGTAGATLTIGTGGITTLSSVAEATAPANSETSSYGGGSVYVESSLGVVLGASQTWTVSSGSWLQVDGTISGTGRQLTLAGDGVTALNGANTYSGGTVLNASNVYVGHDTALGTGAVTAQGHSSLFAIGSRLLANALQLNGSFLDVFAPLTDLRLSGAVTLGASTQLRFYGERLYLDGPIGETGGARKLTIGGGGAVVISGTSSYTGGTAVDFGGLVFRNPASVPATGSLSSQASGYIGIGFNTNVQTGFIAKFDRANTYGTIGFDTDPSATGPLTIATPIDLTGFNSSSRLGSATRAVLSGSITPPSSGYRFGGGGGTLTVSSALTGSHAVEAESDLGYALKLNLTSTGNSYTGGTRAEHSAIVFGAGAVPATGTMRLDYGGYIGAQDYGLLPNAWISRFATDTLTGIIGFDTDNVANPIVVGSILSPVTPLDLSRFTATGSSIALGTSSAAILAGPIILPSNQPNYHFAGYKGGWLTVASDLSGARRVHIGEQFGAYPDFDPNDGTRMSTVFLNGANTHTGGTVLESGRLVLGSTSALGTGPLTIASATVESTARLETLLTGNPAFSNPVVLDGDLEISGVNPFTLSGPISSTWSSVEIIKSGAFNLTLSGNNAAYPGDLYINAGSVTFAHNNAAGQGTLGFGGPSGGTAIFSTPAPAIGGLESDTSTAQVQLASGSTLTINQEDFTVYRGTIQGSAGIVKTGGGALRLESASPFSGGTTIRGGTIGVATTGALGTGNITVDGATSTLLVEPGVTVANAISFGSAGGMITGGGTIGSNVTVTSNAGIAPGHSPGMLTFAQNLTFAGGSFLDIEVRDASAGAGFGWDLVQVDGTLAFTATLGSPFTVHLSSLGADGLGGAAGNFVATSPYSWTIANATGGITGFNSAAVTIDAGSFLNPLGGGAFSVAQSGNALLLNFTPVPEPSTWALMITGAAAIAITTLRRRSRK